MTDVQDNTNNNHPEQPNNTNNTAKPQDNKDSPTNNKDGNGAEKKDENPTEKVTFKLKNFSKIKDRKHYTDHFELCALKWYDSPFFLS